jgi:hypothetical protein
MSGFFSALRSSGMRRRDCPRFSDLNRLTSERFRSTPRTCGALPAHPEPTVSWHRGFRRGAHARHKTTPVHHAARRLRAFRQGLEDNGYAEGENVTITYRFAENQIDRLPALAADRELVAKRLEILRELVPGAVRVGLLIGSNVLSAETTLRDVEPAARAMRLQIQVFNAATRQEIEAVFASFARERPDALFVASDTFLTTRRVQLVNLAARHGIPTAFPNRESAELGGLMSYGTSISDAWRQSGAYVGQILKGAKPADLPVVQSSKFELVINLSTARMLGLTVPQTLLVASDEVIE